MSSPGIVVNRFQTGLSVAVAFFLSLFSFESFLLAAGYYHTDGNRILDAQGRPAQFNGIAWVGFETSDRVVRGLSARSLDSYLDQMHQLGFNLLRLPWSDDIFKPLAPDEKLNIDYRLNPDLAGLTPLQVLDKLIEKAGARGLQIILTRQVILDMRSSLGKTQPELWYTDNFLSFNSLTEQTWIEHWQFLARRYLTNSTVIAADLHNEPHGRATWGSGNLKTDWRLAAERAGNAILQIQPNWLILVQGISHADGDPYWWGGNLKSAGQYPVRLKVPNRLVYSAHEYGLSVYKQPWFSSPDFPTNLPAIWDQHWGFIHRQALAPLFVGEFGGRGVDLADPDPFLSKDAAWQNALVDYIRDQRLYWIYWCWNPGGDTGGLLQTNWTTLRQPKYQMLQRLMKP